MNWHEWNYDVVISYSGRDRHFAQQLARELQSHGRYVFFAPDCEPQSSVVGENLPTALSEIYEKHSLFCVVVSSSHYLESPWANLEFEAALKRSQQERDYPYLIVVTVDSHRLSAIPENTGFLDAREGISEVAATISAKVRSTIIKQRSHIHESIWIIYLAIAALLLSPSGMLWEWDRTDIYSHVVTYTSWLAAVVTSLCVVRYLRGGRVQSIIRKLIIVGVFAAYMIITQAWWHTTIIMTVWYGYCLLIACVGLWYFDAKEFMGVLSLPTYAPLGTFMIGMIAAIACAFILYGQLGDHMWDEVFFQMLRIVVGFAASSIGLYFLCRPVVLRPRPPQDVGFP